jgi:uncharacterized repeat protein (TIGR01451 family)
MSPHGLSLKSFEDRAGIRVDLRMAFILAAFFLIGSPRAHAQFTVGQSIYFYETFSNTGSVNFNSVTISAPVAPDLTFNSCAGAPCSNNAGTVIWSVGTLLPGQSIAVTYFATITSCAATISSVQATINVGSPLTVIYGNPLTFTVNCLTDTPTVSPTPRKQGHPPSLRPSPIHPPLR